MDLFETLYRRKSVRHYTGKGPTDEQLEIILKAAYASPVVSGRFADMHVTVIKRKEILEAIEENASKATGVRSHPLYGAPVLILVSVHPKEETPSNSEYSSAAMVVHNMALAATALGLGSCDIWGSLRLANERDQLVKMYELPQGFVACCGVIIGETDEDFPVRDIPEEKIKTKILE